MTQVDSSDVRQFIRDIIEAIELAVRDWQTNYVVAKVGLKLSTVAENTGAAGIKLKIPLIDDLLNLSYEGLRSVTNEIHFELEHDQIRTDVAVDSAEVREAIAAAVNAIKAALAVLRADPANVYSLKKTTVNLKFAKDDQGNISFLTLEAAHKVKVSQEVILEVSIPS